FIPVDEMLVLEDDTQRLEIYRVIEHGHMAHAVFAYLPEERIFMEGDLSDVSWGMHWWGSALVANVEHYGLDPETNVAVHGDGPLPFAETVANSQAQSEAAQAYCETSEASGYFVFGCPVQYDTEGPLALTPR